MAFSVLCADLIEGRFPELGIAQQVAQQTPGRRSGPSLPGQLSKERKASARVSVHFDRHKLDILVVFIGIRNYLHNARGFR
jgi:hypothetical protein